MNVEVSMHTRRYLPKGEADVVEQHLQDDGFVTIQKKMPRVNGLFKVKARKVLQLNGNKAG